MAPRKTPAKSPAKRPAKRPAAKKAAKRPADPPYDGPTDLERRGRRLWTDVVAAGKPDAPGLVLLEEACRIADRLDRLDAIITGSAGDWLTFPEGHDLADLEVTVNVPLAEARQQATALVRVLTPLLKNAAAAPSKPEASRADQLAAKRAARLAATARP